MILITEDEKRIVDIGTCDVWKSLYSTVVSCIKNAKETYPNALHILQEAKCDSSKGYITAREINLIRDELSKYSPENIVYDIDDPNAVAPWNGSISPIITSCSNFYVTADGKDLLYEIVSILCYAEICNVNISSLD